MGTLFLDEIGEMELGIQAKLLKVLEQKTFRRVGGLAEIEADVRLIAATHRNLVQDVTAGRFREDLFYRLNVFSIELPPLRERPRIFLHSQPPFFRNFAGILMTAGFPRKPCAAAIVCVARKRP